VTFSSSLRVGFWRSSISISDRLGFLLFCSLFCRLPRPIGTVSLDVPTVAMWVEVVFLDFRYSSLIPPCFFVSVVPSFTIFCFCLRCICELVITLKSGRCVFRLSPSPKLVKGLPTSRFLLPGRRPFHTLFSSLSFREFWPPKSQCLFPSPF